MVPFSKRFIFISFFLLAVFLKSGFPDEFFSIELWCELQPVTADTDAIDSFSEEEAYKHLFEEARLIFGGMIYGYRFTYIPQDNARGVTEFFELVPLGEIPWGDKNLRIVQREVRENRLCARFVYDLAAFQEERINNWQTLAIPRAMGRGEGKFMLGMEEKAAARANAVKDAVRNHLRPVVFNKPREIRGEVLFIACPVTIIKSGAYITTVTIKIDVKEIRPYTIF